MVRLGLFGEAAEVHPALAFIRIYLAGHLYDISRIGPMIVQLAQYTST